MITPRQYVRNVNASRRAHDNAHRLGWRLLEMLGAPEHDGANAIIVSVVSEADDGSRHIGLRAITVPDGVLTEPGAYEVRRVPGPRELP